MNKYILSTSLFLCTAFTASLAEEKTVAGRYTNTTGSRVDIRGVTATTDLILNSTPNETANTGEMYRTPTATTVHTIKAIDNSSGTEEKGKVNLASSDPDVAPLTVNVNSNTTITGISAASWAQNFARLVVTNSHAEASKASVTLDFGDELKIDSSTSGQQQSLAINNITGTVKAKETILGKSALAESYITIGTGTNVEWYGKITVGNGTSKKSAKLNVDGTLEMKKLNGVSSIINVGNGCNFNISSTGNVSITDNSVILAKGATATVDGALVFGGGSSATINGTLLLNNTTPSKQMNFYALNSIGTFVQATATSNNGVRFWRTANINSGADWTVDEIVDIAGNYVSGVAYTTTRAKLNINEGSTFVINKVDGKTARIRLWGNSELHLYKENGITDQNGNGVRLASALNQYSEYGSEVYVYSKQTFEDLYITGGSALDIYLVDDTAQLIFEKEGKTITNDSADTLRVFNFRENSIYVGTSALNQAGIDNAKFYAGADESSQLLENVYVNSQGWLTAIAVPEPAEWAAILGSLALGLAIYRRRK